MYIDSITSEVVLELEKRRPCPTPNKRTVEANLSLAAALHVLIKPHVTNLQLSNGDFAKNGKKESRRAEGCKIKNLLVIAIIRITSFTIY